MSPRELLTEYLAATKTRWDIPRQPEIISRELGVTIKYARMSDEVLSIPRGIDLNKAGGTGFFVPRPKPTIVLPLRQTGPVTRDLFTWAHELGHFLVWESLRIVPGNDYWAHEAACNWFAGEFLVPENIARDIAGSPSREWLTAVDDLAAKCDVSWIVAANSLTSVSAGRVVFLWMEARGTKVIAKNPSVLHYCGKPLGNRASFDDAELCRIIQRLGHGATTVTTLSSDFGQLPTKDGIALLRRTNVGVQAMVRLHRKSALPKENTHS
ncbi:MAG: hypothetical protein HONBIEJF_00556 [Fimbriimonadaceae bacterium]|nr:hypothetical protein [Fimbriimonadaceae bacterium]